MPGVIGFDIGGANLKAAHQDGPTVSRGFPLWKSPELLAQNLQEMLAELPDANRLAVTMTGELADCFQTKAEGVDAILTAVESVADSRPTFVWQTGAEFVDTTFAREVPMLVAAANWHALATWVGKMVPDGAALLVDIGSTTTDIIPLQNGMPIPTGLTDCERLASGELVYSGAARTPLCAIAHSVPFRGKYCPVAAELFATSLDLYLLLDEISEAPDCHETANGQPTTKHAAWQRMTRMLCCDESEITLEESIELARFFADVQQQRIRGAWKKVLLQLEQDAGRACESLLISGSGTFLAQRILQEFDEMQAVQPILLREMFSTEVATAACATAVARLAAERL